MEDKDLAKRKLDVFMNTMSEAWSGNTEYFSNTVQHIIERSFKDVNYANTVMQILYLASEANIPRDIDPAIRQLIRDFYPNRDEPVNLDVAIKTFMFNKESLSLFMAQISRLTKER